MRGRRAGGVDIAHLSHLCECSPPGQPWPGSLSSHHAALRVLPMDGWRKPCSGASPGSSGKPWGCQQPPAFLKGGPTVSRASRHFHAASSRLPKPGCLIPGPRLEHLGHWGHGAHPLKALRGRAPFIENRCWNMFTGLPV